MSSAFDIQYDLNSDKITIKISSDFILDIYSCVEA